jgi:hypothetical protein
MENMYSMPENFDPKDLPDIPTLINTILEIMEFVTSDTMLKLKKEDNKEFILEAFKKFPTFSDRYYGLFQKILAGDDISMAVHMLANLQKVKDGKVTMDKAEEMIGNKLEKTFIHPQLTKKQINDLQKAKANLKK